MILLLDIGNTHAHVGLATPGRIIRVHDIPTRDVLGGHLAARLRGLYPGVRLGGAAMASVVPRASGLAREVVRRLSGRPPLELTPGTVRGITVDYPRPASIGQDRLANAMAARARFGAPVVVVDFGTAVTFDVVSAAGSYVGGVIAPGLSAMTDYLHEKTALLPRIRIREPRSSIGRSTREAMLVGAVHGYRGLVRQVISGLREELGHGALPVVATGGYARLMARALPEITAVAPNLTLEGLRLLWLQHHPLPGRPGRSRLPKNP
ncbi:MAG: type III pantothenate kinase [Verrucomicrobiota bacterium]|jgi:type III pantothenate kinase